MDLFWNDGMLGRVTHHMVMPRTARAPRCCRFCSSPIAPSSVSRNAPQLGEMYKRKGQLFRE